METGLWVCHHRAFLPDSWVSSGPWETGERGRLQEFSILKYRVHSTLTWSFAFLAMNMHDSPQAGRAVDWKVFGDDLCEHFGFSFTTLLSHMLRMGNHIKKQACCLFRSKLLSNDYASRCFSTSIWSGRLSLKHMSLQSCSPSSHQKSRQVNICICHIAKLVDSRWDGDVEVRTARLLFLWPAVTQACIYPDGCYLVQRKTMTELWAVSVI